MSKHSMYKYNTLANLEFKFHIWQCKNNFYSSYYALIVYNRYWKRLSPTYSASLRPLWHTLTLNNENTNLRWWKVVWTKFWPRYKRTIVKSQNKETMVVKFRDNAILILIFHYNCDFSTFRHWIFNFSSSIYSL
jgi:hypothetical protein